MTRNKNPSQAQKDFMKKFCSIVMPGYDKRKGYINVQKKVEVLNIDPRTFYHWKNCETMPTMQNLFAILEERGYRLDIVPVYE